MRKLKNGKEIAELQSAVTLTIKTKCPEKWILIDQETGEIYTGYATEGKHSWKKLNSTIKDIVDHAAV